MIRGLNSADIAEADALLGAAFGSAVSHRARLERYLAIQPDGWFGAFAADRMVGMVGGFDYGAFGHVGLMAVHPAEQRAGHGRRLLEQVFRWLEERGVPAVILDATDEGERLYLSAGFEDCGRSHEFRGQGGGQGGRRGELHEVIALDRELFGADRTRMWTRLVTEDPSRLIATGGGYAYAQDDLLGPFGARTVEDARALLAAAPARPLRVQVPSQNLVAADILAGLGFTLVRAPRHLRRGDRAAWPDWSRIWGKGSFSLA